MPGAFELHVPQFALAVAYLRDQKRAAIAQLPRPVRRTDGRNRPSPAARRRERAGGRKKSRRKAGSRKKFGIEPDQRRGFWIGMDQARTRRPPSPPASWCRNRPAAARTYCPLRRRTISRGSARLELIGVSLRASAPGCNFPVRPGSATGPVCGKTRMMGLAARDFAQMPVQFPHPQRHADIVRREGLAVRAQDARAFVKAARRQRNIGGDDDVARRRYVRRSSHRRRRRLRAPSHGRPADWPKGAIRRCRRW